MAQRCVGSGLLSTKTVCVNSFAMAFRLAKHPRNGRLIEWQPLCVSPQLVGLREFQSFATSSGWTDASMMFYWVSKKKSMRLTDGDVVITIPVATASTTALPISTTCKCRSRLLRTTTSEYDILKCSGLRSDCNNH